MISSFLKMSIGRGRKFSFLPGAAMAPAVVLVEKVAQKQTSDRLRGAIARSAIIRL
jgi:hypothetical protein